MRIDSVSTFVDAALELTERFSCDDGPWYRGAGGSGHSLVPGLYRRSDVQEWEVVTEFKSQAHLYADRGFRLRFSSRRDRWEWYFLVQHFGLPTRLLDWTENPLVALYFAVIESAPPSPCVWALDPNRLNDLSVGDPTLVVPRGEFSSHWLCKESAGQAGGCEPGKAANFEWGGKPFSNAGPLAIYPIRSNPRIVAQQGVFTVHGSERRGLEEYLETKLPGDAQSVLRRLEIDPNRADCIRNGLERLSLHQLALFPELPQLADHIRMRLKLDST